jgi:hypothetical protein
VLAFQLIGSLLAIPVGLASAYSVYQSNFSAAAKCQSLRGSIISVLDRNADASTLRALARRDVLSFETSCAKVDPDAVAAFKSLLVQKSAAAPVAAATPPQQVRAPTPAPEAAKAPTASVAAPAPKAVHRDTVAADANWIASVRHALEHKEQERQEHSARAEPVNLPATSWNPPPVQSPPPLVIYRQPAAAPALPPAVPIASAPAPAADVADHPVPPQTIPPPVPPTKPAEAKTHTGIGGWIANIPVVNRLVGN